MWLSDDQLERGRIGDPAEGEAASSDRIGGLLPADCLERFQFEWFADSESEVGLSYSGWEADGLGADDLDFGQLPQAIGLQIGFDGQLQDSRSAGECMGKRVGERDGPGLFGS